jgi:hypothetical protein
MTIEKSPVSLCGRCRYYDWSVAVFADKAGSSWLDECHHPVEYTAGDDVNECDGFCEK